MNEQNKNYYTNPDIAKKAKSRFSSYYFSLYLSIITGARDSFRYGIFKNVKIKYIDLFSGTGSFLDNGEHINSVPLNVLKSIKEHNIPNIDLYFNDLYCSDELKKEIVRQYGAVPNNVTIDNKDATQINIKTLFSHNEIVLSYIDSKSYLCCEVNTINKLISNPLSDCIMYLNTEHFHRFLNAPKEKDNFIKFFGDEKTFQNFKSLRENGASKNEFALNLLKNFISRLNACHGSNLQYLPIFFKKSKSDSSICHILLVISKSAYGLKKIRDSFCTISRNDPHDGKVQKDFYFENERIVVYVEPNLNQLTLFDEDESLFNALFNTLPFNKGGMSRDELLCEIDRISIAENKCLSGYSKPFLNRLLSYLENNKKIYVKPERKSVGRCYKYGEKTKIYKDENYENN